MVIIKTIFGGQKLFVFFNDKLTLTHISTPLRKGPQSYSLDNASSLTVGKCVYYVSFNEWVKFKPYGNHCYRLYKSNGSATNIYILKGKYPNIDLLENNFNITAAVIFKYNGKRYLMGTFPQKDGSGYCGFTYNFNITPSGVDGPSTPDSGGFTPPNIPTGASDTGLYGWPYMNIEGATAENIEQMINLKGGSLDGVRTQPYVIYIDPEAQ